MSVKMAAGFFALALTFGVSTAWAQDTPQDQTQTPDTGKATAKADTKGAESVTGCLQKSGDAYTLTADDGTVWHVASKSVDLGEHVNHTVTVSGMGREHTKSKSTADNNGETTEKSKEVHRLHVTKLSMVSESCQK
jgi:type V secretory pathway adhesin AidA